jgi:adenylate cyclase
MPAPGLRVPSSVMGYADLWFDPDGTVRRWSPFRQHGEEMFKGFPLAIAERYRRAPVLNMTAGGTRWGAPGGPAVPTVEDGSLVINYVGPPESFQTVAYARVLDHTVPLGAFRDKIVLVGSTAVAADMFLTPHYNRALPETSRLMPGVEIHANIVDMLLRGGFVHRTGWVLDALLLALVSVLAAVATSWRRPLPSLAVLTATLAACVTVGYQAFARFDVWVPVVAPLLAAPLTWAGLFALGYVRERREKDFVRSVLDRYVSPTVIDELVAGGVDLALGGRRRPLTILFADVRGFTGLSERIAPEPLVSLLGEYFAASTRIILAHGGTVDKFIGDAVMAFWGAPSPTADHALRAVQAALEMQAAARQIDARAQARLGERLRIGVGINSGDAVVGQIGAPERMSYTAVGDPVNVAARVESLTREHEADILITQSTYELVKFEVQAEPLGVMHVKGRTDPVALYRVSGLKSAGG